MATSDQMPQGNLAEMRSKWGWFVALGVLVLALGIIAAGNLLVATVVSVFFVGSLMIVAGVIEIIHAFGVKSWAASSGGCLAASSMSSPAGSPSSTRC